jgi:D-alanyl-lipoteichoic acid acyltransferase DltB (MBOAT superfamily)
MRNFDLPYFSRSPQEFWRRWHISLSRWLRDYLYIPLGGSRHGEAFTYRNLMVTMLLGGLWHGAAWTFVAWGGFHGALQVIARALSLDHVLAARKPDSIANVAVHVAAWFATSIMIGIGWVFFRAHSFADAATILSNGLTPTGFSFRAFGTLLYYITPLIVVEIWQRFQPDLPTLFREPPFLARYSAAVCLVLGMMLLSAEGGRQFIYFDF